MATKKSTKKASTKDSSKGTSLAAPENSETQAVKQQLVRELFKPIGKAGVSPEGLTGTGFTYRHDWGNRRGQWRLTLNWSSINCNSRVFVSASEFGGGAQCDFTGDARYTVHNVSAASGKVTVWVNIEWPSNIRVRLTYLVVNP